MVVCSRRGHRGEFLSSRPDPNWRRPDKVPVNWKDKDTLYRLGAVGRDGPRCECYGGDCVTVVYGRPMKAVCRQRLELGPRDSTTRVIEALFILCTPTQWSASLRIVFAAHAVD